MGPYIPQFGSVWNGFFLLGNSILISLSFFKGNFNLLNVLGMATNEILGVLNVIDREMVQ